MTTGPDAPKSIATGLVPVGNTDKALTLKTMTSEQQLRRWLEGWPIEDVIA